MAISSRKRLKAAFYLLPFVIILVCFVRKEIENRRDKIDFSKTRHVAAKYVAVPADDYVESYPPGKAPRNSTNRPISQMELYPSATPSPAGALSGRILFVNGGHGWVYNNGLGANAGWHTGRGVYNGIIEDYGNVDQMNLFVPYCFNAGATIVPFRPIGRQTNEVVLDNSSADVTFIGEWMDSASEVYFGHPGQVPYRYTFIDSKATSTAVYAPRIPAAGIYPVYTWVRHGADRTAQLYCINHSQGQALVRVPHYMVGNGWVYLGSYYFNAGKDTNTAAVIISNLRAADAPGSVVVADAIRFGNGMGDAIPRPRAGELTIPSGYPREEECSRYWIQAEIGNGQSASIYESTSMDESDNVNAPPRMARQMNRETAGSAFQRLYLSFHSNSNGRRRGSLALFNNPMLYPLASTPNQDKLAEILGREVNDSLSALTNFPIPWYNREKDVTFSRQDFAFGEINNLSIGNEFDAAILEVGYHDNAEDAALLREPLVRQTIAKSAYRAVVRYMHEFDNAPEAFIPEPPECLTAKAIGTNAIKVSWSIGTNLPPEYFRVYRSTTGLGYGTPIRVAGTNTSIVVNCASESQLYFRVTACTAAGESLMSSAVGCGVTRVLPRVLIVNAFKRLDQTLNVVQKAGPGIGGPSGGYEAFQRVIPAEMNAGDVICAYGDELSRHSIAFDSCDARSLSENSIALTDYRAVFWAGGRHAPFDHLLSSMENTKVKEFLSKGGNVFVSSSAPEFRTDWSSNSLANDYITATVKTTIPVTNTVVLRGVADFVSITNVSLTSSLRFYDAIELNGTKAMAILKDDIGNTVACFSNYKQSGGGRIIACSFPLETIESTHAKADLMRMICNSLDLSTK